MAFLLGIIILVIGLIISIGLHECGHLLPAKKFGALVPQFMIGFGPTLFSRKHGETEYGVKAFLLGGRRKPATPRCLRFPYLSANVPFTTCRFPAA